MALLIEALKDSGVRDRAIEGLGSLGPEAAPALSALLEELRLARKHDSFKVAAVVRALGRIGPGAAAAVPVLRELIASSIPLSVSDDKEVEAARALGRIGPAAGETIPELVDLLLKYPRPVPIFGWFNNNAVIVRALERVAAGSPNKMVPDLVRALRLPPEARMMQESFILSPNQFDRRIGVVEVIVRLGPQARGTASALRAVIAEPPSKNPNDLLRPAAAEALWRVEGKADDALPVLLAGLTERLDFFMKGLPADPRGSSRHGRAAAALGRIGEPAKSALPALLVELEKGLTAHDRLDAAEAVWRLTGDAKPILPLLRTALAGKLVGQLPDKKTQARAIAILGLMGKAAGDAAPALAAAIRAEDEANARQGNIHVFKRDEEDEDPNTTDLIRRTGLPVLRELDPATAKAFETPVKMP